MIYDRHGTLMARSRPSFVVALIPSEVTDVKAELDTLAEMIGTDRSKLWARLLHHRGINYASFDEVVASEPYGPVMLVSDLPVAAVARVSEVLTALPGVDLEVQPTARLSVRTDRLRISSATSARSTKKSTSASSRAATRPTTSSGKTDWN